MLPLPPHSMPGTIVTLESRTSPVPPTSFLGGPNPQEAPEAAASYLRALGLYMALVERLERLK